MWSRLRRPRAGSQGGLIGSSRVSIIVEQTELALTATPKIPDTEVPDDADDEILQAPFALGLAALQLGFSG